MFDDARAMRRDARGADMVRVEAFDQPKACSGEKTPGPASGALANLGAVLAETERAVAAAPGSARVVRDAHRRLAGAVAAAPAEPPAPPSAPVTSTPLTVTATAARGRSRWRSHKPWKVTFQATGAEPAAGEVISSLSQGATGPVFVEPLPWVLAQPEAASPRTGARAPEPWGSVWAGPDGRCLALGDALEPVG
jgi:hypothetical protein